MKIHDDIILAGDVRDLSFDPDADTGKGFGIHTDDDGKRVLIVDRIVVRDGVHNSCNTHYQSSSSAKWDITHNLGRFPSVTVVDSAGSEVVGDVTYDSDNQVTVRFMAAFSGKAYLN